MEKILNTVCDFDKCCGCMACIDICSKNAISIKDSLISFNAFIDTNKCIKCNLCHSVCQNNSSPVFSKPIYWYQGWSSVDEIRKNGSSGGLAGAISYAFIEDGGEVFSCFFNNGNFVFDGVSELEELKKFAGSKYVKTNPSGCYKKIKYKLNQNKKVLFIGLPCQVAALKNYIGDCDNNNLYTIDLICHGTPSIGILEMFLNQYDSSLKEIKSIKFRNKEKFAISNSNKSFVFDNVSDKYTIAFLNSLTYTENCYSCKYARLDRVSDITLGDSWGSDFDSSIRAQGISLILCMNDKGHDLIRNSQVSLHKVNLENAVLNNHQLHHPSIKPKNYNSFWKGVFQHKRFNSLVYKSLFKPCIKQDIKRILIKLKLIGGG